MVHASGRLIHQTEREFAEIVLGQALGFIGQDPDRNARYIIGAIDHMARGESQNIIRSWAQNWLAENGQGRALLSRMVKNTSPEVRRRFVARFVVNLGFRGITDEKRFVEEHGFAPPYTMLISPTMRCNYRCRGCYASSYERKEDMKPEVFDRLLFEAEKIGTNFFNVLGGEPFVYPQLLDILSHHDKSCFQVYTNGSFIDKTMAKKLVELGNIAPQISVNGPEEYTDASRGEGAFRTAMQAMDNLREAGCVFGFSTLVSRDNVDAVCSEKWVDLLIEKGALYGWLFLYMPVGDEPDMNLMPTPEQRNQLRIALTKFQKTKPIVMIDFWNYGIYSRGCIAGGTYLHVNHRGDVEPCIFCHFATHNINKCSLIEALSSPFFKSIRANQPFGYNTLLPCPMLDHNHEMWKIIQQNNARPTHEGAAKMFTAYNAEMKLYAEGVRKIMDEAWYKDGYSEWVPDWTSAGISPEKFKALRKAFEESRNGNDPPSDEKN